MIQSMTGYGEGIYTENNLTVTTEIRSVNSRFSELSIKIPKSISNHENDIKEIIKDRIGRGKINIFISFNEDYQGKIPLKINEAYVKSYLKLLKDLKKISKIKETVKLSHLTQFSEIFEFNESDEDDTFAWSVAKKSIDLAVEALLTMRKNEGKFLENDLIGRIKKLEEKISSIEEISKNKVPEEREKLKERIQQLIKEIPVDENRLEMEIALLSDKLDVTEECVRFNSHNEFFLKSLNDSEPSGKKLTFLTQEMNREINTIGSKSNDSVIAHIVVEIKEELERIREQLQNIE
jgi:uncharacterized protein (TIGR00255 family)